MKRVVLDVVRRVMGTTALANELGRLRVDFSAMLEAQRSVLDEIGCLRAQLNKGGAELSAALNAQQLAVDTIVAGLEADRSERREAVEAIDPVPCSEADICARVSPQAVFVLGYARSSTSILAQLVNASPQALLLTEANFYLAQQAPRFSDAYNAQHVSFGNQISKSSYAPDLIPDRDHSWWQWLGAASSRFQVVGDKMAFSRYHLDAAGAENVRRFFEGRFFDARYVCMVRNPVSTMISCARMFGIEDDALLRVQLCGWLTYVQLWADWLRVFPNVLPIIADRIDAGTVGQLQEFLGLDLGNARELLDRAQVRTHSVPPQFVSLQRFGTELDRIFAAMERALGEERVLWQAGQKRDLRLNDTRDDPAAITAIAPHALGEVWARAEALKRDIVAMSD